VIKREAESELINLAKQFKAVAVVGPMRMIKEGNSFLPVQIIFFFRKVFLKVWPDVSLI